MVEIQGILNVGAWLSNNVSTELLGTSREGFLRNKDNHEKLVAAMVASVASFRTGRVHIPGFLSSTNDAVDTAVVDSQGTGAALQVVSTWGNPAQIVPDDLTDLIWSRVEQKHRKGREYCRDNHLAVFVGQQNYDRIGLEELHDRIVQDPFFANYWIVAPYNSDDVCQFLVCEIYSEGDTQQYECVIDFTPPNPVSINYLSSLDEGDDLIPLHSFLAIR